MWGHAWISNLNSLVSLQKIFELELVQRDCLILSLWAIQWEFVMRNACFMTASAVVSIVNNGGWCCHGPLTRYVKLRIAHAPGMPGTFPPPQTSKETASLRSRHASRHVRHVPWCILGSLNRGGRENVPGIPGACATRKFAYVVRGPWSERWS